MGSQLRELPLKVRATRKAAIMLSLVKIEEGVNGADVPLCEGDASGAH